MSARLKLFIAGAGLIGKRHAEAIHRVEGVELAGIVDPGEAGRAYALDAGLPWFAHIDEMFARAKPDGVILATPTPLHVEQGLACVAASCPAIVEKPIAVSADDAQNLVGAARRAGVPLMVGHHRRFNPLVQRARDVIDAGEIGDFRAVHANCWFYKPDYYFDEAPWRKRKGAGPISVNLVHDIDLIRHLCGEIVTVQAQASPSSRDFENEEVAAAVLSFDNGGVGTVTVSDSVVSPWSWELTSRENPRYPAAPQSCYMIGGTKGSISVPDLTLWTHDGAPDWWSPINATKLIQDFSDPLVNQITHFAKVIAGEASPLVPAEEGLKTLRVIEAIQTAARTGEIVRLEAVEHTDATSLLEAAP